MSGCPEWRDAVVERALLDDAADPALAKHLAVCPACAAALRESQAAAARMDEALHRLAAVEPPSYGPDRVMARVSERNRAAVSYWWRWAAAASLAAILIVIVLWTRRPPPRTDVAALAEWRSPTEALLRPPVGAAWNSMPRLGEGFFEVKPLGEMHAQ
jgi:anti-sigma factor RsiW